MPMRLSQCDPMRDSRSGSGERAATVRGGGGDGGGISGYDGWPGTGAAGGIAGVACAGGVGCAAGAAAEGCQDASIPSLCSMREMRFASSARMRRIASRSLWDGSIGTANYRRNNPALHGKKRRTTKGTKSHEGIHDRGVPSCDFVSFVVTIFPLCRLRGAAVQAQLFRDRLQGFYAEVDVLVEIDAQVFRAINDVVAVHFAGEGLVFHSF